MHTHTRAGATVPEKHIPIQHTPKLSPLQMQKANEYTYSKKQINRYLKEIIDNDGDMANKLNKAVELVQLWLAQDFSYESKNVRLDLIRHLPEQSLYNLLRNFLVKCCYVTHSELYSAKAIECATLITCYGSRRDAIITAAELLTQMAAADLIDLFEQTHLSTNGKEYTQIYLQLGITLPEELMKYIAKSQCLPPLVCAPDIVTRNNQSGYLTFNEPVMLNSTRHHKNARLPLDVINTLNQTALSINLEFMLNVEDISNKPLNTVEKQERWDELKQQTHEFAYLLWEQSQGNTRQPQAIWFTHNLDNRLRIYCRGYHLNYQANAYRKAMIEFNAQEIVNVPENPESDASTTVQRSSTTVLEYSSFEWLLIDAASQWGLDSKEFPIRLAWARENLHQLYELGAHRIKETHENGGKWKEYPLYMKAALAIDEVLAGKPISHKIGLDAVNSGVQILSVLTGCQAGAKSTGLVDPDVRADAYTDCTEVMRESLPEFDPAEIDREDIKVAFMTAIYGSRAEPKKLFGEATPALEAFHKAVHTIAPGAMKAVEILRNAWQENALKHVWTLPDECDAIVPVTDKVETDIEVDELNHYKFTAQYKINTGLESGLALIANVTHSVDAYVLRTMVRRCNYEPELVQQALDRVTDELYSRALEPANKKTTGSLFVFSAPVNSFSQRYEQCQLADMSIMPYLSANTVGALSGDHLRALKKLFERVLQNPPIELICIHDCFSCLPSGVNTLRRHYREILADLADSTLFEDLLNQITGDDTHYEKITQDLSTYILESNYGLC